MKTRFMRPIVLIGLALLSSFCIAQDNIILTVEDENVSVEDFEAIFKKNNRDSAITKASLDEYMELFINFKLKVMEAKELGLDTNQSFIRELAGYRKQLARPYLIDNELLDEIVETAYERKKTEIRASHLLVNLDVNATAQDTLKAWNRIMKLRKRIMDGESFESVVASKAGSDDPSAINNKGDLGYFSAFQMVYPFEEAAYNLKVGEVSQPVRTRYGYHLIKLTDKREAKGEVKVAHIMTRVKDMNNQEEVKAAEDRIREIYEQVKDGADFAEMARKHSDDKTSGREGGELPFFGTGKMVENFEKVAFETAPGEISEPFMTQYGWHIVKGIERKTIPSFEEMENELKSKVSRDARAERTTDSFLAKLRKEYEVEDYGDKNLKYVIQAADSSLWDGIIEVREKYLDKPLLKIQETTYSVADYVDYLSGRRQNRKRSPERIVREKFESWQRSTLLDYEDAQLERKYNDFRLLMNEYRDGILLFELTDQKVWSKAVQDSSGLEAFYEKNKKNYMWPERWDANIYTCDNSKIAKKLGKMVSKGVDYEKIEAKLNKKSELNLRKESGVFTLEERPILKNAPKSSGVSDPIEKDGQFFVIEVKEFMTPSPKKLDEARGMVTADYQKYLEEEWIKELREKYDFKVNRELLYTIK
jgi:peptidyl-prolyl cis-trans isomerase SurA